MTTNTNEVGPLEAMADSIPVSDVRMIQRKIDVFCFKGSKITAIEDGTSLDGVYNDYYVTVYNDVLADSAVIKVRVWGNLYAEARRVSGCGGI